MASVNALITLLLCLGIFIIVVSLVAIRMRGIFKGYLFSGAVMKLDKADFDDPDVQELIEVGQEVYSKKLARNLEDRRLGLTEADIEAIREKKKAPRPDLDDASGIRDLLEEGREEEAVEVYQKFAGVDEYTARDMVEQIKREME
jgi:hypothetical protein